MSMNKTFKQDGGFEILLNLRFDAISKILQRAELADFSKMSCGYGDGVLGSSDAKKNWLAIAKL